MDASAGISDGTVEGSKSYLSTYVIRGVGTSIGKIVELEVYTGNQYAQIY